MMNNRILLIVTVVLVAVVVVLNMGERQGPATAATGQLLLPDLASRVDQLASIVIIGAGDRTIATLDRQNDHWTVRERDGYPANVAQIRDTLSALAEARIVEPKTANERFYDRLGVESVALEDATGTAVALIAGDETTTVIIGDMAAAGQRFVRLADAAESYQIDRDPAPATEIGRWLDARILDLPNDRVQQVAIRHVAADEAADEVLTLHRASADQTNFTVEPIPDGRELLYPGVGNTVAGALRNLRLEDVERAAMTADAVVEYRTFDGLIIVVEGMRDGERAFATFRAEVDVEVAGDALAARQSEAEAINARVAGWRYVLPGFQYDQIARRIADMLQSA